jgi:hypothetical protein
MTTPGSCSPTVGAVMTSSGRTASCPSRLDFFAVASAAEAIALPIHLRVIEDRWAAALQGCREPSLVTHSPPLDGLHRLLAEGHVTEQFAQQIATAFRQADMGSLVANWSSGASSDYDAAVAAGKWVPSKREGWTMLRFDTSDRGRLLEVKGNLTTATHVVVMVPGMTNELSNVDRDFRNRANVLYDELVARAQPGEDIAVIMWLGYSNPQALQLGAAAASKMARDGATTLTDDMRAFRATGTLAEVTVVAHSYGTILAGEAMQKGLPVDRLVVVGSPGMNVADRAALGSPDVELYASSVGERPGPAASVFRRIGRLLHPGNPVAAMLVDIATGKDWAASTANVGAHGADPAESTFGSTVFPSDGQGHSAYFEPRSLALANVALIGLGRRPVDDLADTEVPKRTQTIRP